MSFINPPEIEMESITVRYGESATKAIDRVSLKVNKGGIHLISGPNGAGKSTLAGVLCGLVRPTKGKVYLKGRLAKISSPCDAHRCGIAVVPQHAHLVPEFSVAENVILGEEPTGPLLFFDRKRSIEKVQSLINDYQFSLKPEELGKGLSVGQRQQVEILRMLHQQMNLLVLDEPTALMEEKETHHFWGLVGNLAESGKTIIAITHRVSNVEDLVTGATVLRKGRAVFSGFLKEIGGYAAMEKLTGKITSGLTPKATASSLAKVSCGDPLLVCEGLSCKVRDGEGLESVSFRLSRSKILGITSDKSGKLKTLEELLCGVWSPTSGKIWYKGEARSPRWGLQECRLARWAYVPSDRWERGCAPQLTVLENLMPPLKVPLFFARSFWRKRFLKLLAQYGIDESLGKLFGKLSGGSQQKVILARELESDAEFFLLVEPTGGLDAASCKLIHERMTEIAHKGGAILILSSDFREIKMLSDEILFL